MRSGAIAIFAFWLAGSGPAQALEEIALGFGNYWRVVFSSLEIEKSSAFFTSGSKLGVTNATKDVSVFIANSYGMSLSDAERARRFGWPSDRMEMQSRMMGGFERSAGPLFVSVAAGVSQARMQAQTQPEPLRRLYAWALANDVDPRLVPQLAMALHPAAVRGLLPPRMETFTGGVLDLNIWWRPDPSFYGHLALVGDSAAQSLWTRLRLGYRPGALPFAVGPEAAAATGRNWHKYKLGAHLGDIRLWRFGLDAAAGWMLDETRRWGTYGSFSLYFRF